MYLTKVAQFIPYIIRKTYSLVWTFVIRLTCRKSRNGDMRFFHEIFLRDWKEGIDEIGFFSS